ncbi:right-handed parallel beta-helix repeat-containing protein [Candidatus Pacearchaeota archaeon]|nr:right-handed parallel beta-helix repeat-containing protein [Candidatus Pacearchaeota archaeon]
MNKKVIFVFVVLMLLMVLPFLSADDSDAAPQIDKAYKSSNNNVVYIKSCGKLNKDNTTYKITKSVSASGTCFTIAANNVTLDGQGKTVKYAKSKKGYGIVNNKGYSNMVIQNTVFSDSKSKKGLAAIYTFNASGLKVLGNKIDNEGKSTIGIYIVGDTGKYVSIDTIIRGNDIETKDVGLWIELGSNIIIEDNEIVSSTGLYLFVNRTNMSYNQIEVDNLALIYAYNSIFESNRFESKSSLSEAALSIGGHNNSIKNNEIFSETNGIIASGDMKDNVFVGNQIVSDSSHSDLLLVSSENIDNTYLIDQPITSYSFSSKNQVLHIEKNSIAKIDFLKGINGTGKKLDRELLIRKNLVLINSTTNAGLNRSANVTLYDMDQFKFGEGVNIYKNGQTCNDCYNFTPLDADTIVFNVSGAGLYYIGNSTYQPSINLSDGEEDYVSLSSCRILDQPNKVYKLTKSLSSQGTCFRIEANGITLDGNGNTINYSLSETGNGIFVAGVNGVTIKNLILAEPGPRVAGFFGHAIYINNSINGTIINNTIETYKPYAHGIVLGELYSNNSIFGNYQIINNIIRIHGHYSQGIKSTGYHNNTLQFNDIYSDGRDEPVIFMRSNNNLIRNNSFKSNYWASHGVMTIYESIGNTFLFNEISLSTSPAFSYGAIAIGDSSNNSFILNVIESNTTEIYLYRTPGKNLKIGLMGNIFKSNLLSKNHPKIVQFNISIGESINNTQFIDYSFINYSFGVGRSIIHFEETRFGQIAFTQGINGSGNNLSAEIQISNNSALVNSTINPGLNRSANITFYHMSGWGFTDNAQIYKDSSVCPAGYCHNFTPLTADIVVFNVSGAGRYWVQ